MTRVRGAGRLARVLALLASAALAASGAVTATDADASAAERLFRQAESLGEVEAARTAYREIWTRFDAARYPDLVWRPAARVRAGELALRLGRREEAAVAFVAAIDHEPVSVWGARARLGLARISLQTGDTLAAAETLQEVLDSDPDNDAAEVRAAARRLTLIHRMGLHARAGGRRWASARLLAAPGLELKRPEGVAAAGARLAVVDAATGLVAVVDEEGVIGGRWHLAGAERPSWGADGQLYVSTEEGMVAVGAEAARVGFPAPPTGSGLSLSGVAAGELDGHGQWFILTRRPDEVHLYQDGGYLGALVKDRSARPVDLALDDAGRLLVLDRDADRVLRFDANVAAPAAAGDWRDAQALAVDLTGHLYVLDRGARQVHIFEPGGRRVDSVGPLLPGGIQLESPVDLAVDEAGRILIADNKLPAVVVIE